MMKLIAPSILSADFLRLGNEVKRVEEAGADWIHIDVMDGHFVPNITIGPLVVEAVTRITKLPRDVHLMIENPDAYITDFVKAGSSVITVHAEVCKHLHRTIHAIKDRNIKAGVALNPATPLATIECILEDVDMVLLMSVNPGFGGQTFIPQAIEKIKALRHSFDQRRLNILIEVDGGINVDTIGMVSEAGVDVFVAGSAIFESANYIATMNQFRSIIKT